MFYQILRPFSYLSMSNSGGKYIYDWVIPLFMTFFSVVAIIYGNEWDTDKSFGNNNVASGVYDVVKNLLGFFIAALAAIATFNRPSMDDVIANQFGVSPTIKIMHVDASGQCKHITCKLSRRTFLCMLFSYLTALSFVLIVFHVIFVGTQISQGSLVFSTTVNLIFLFLFWQITVCTFYGLYYLGEKIHY